MNTIKCATAAVSHELLDQFYEKKIVSLFLRHLRLHWEIEEKNTRKSWIYFGAKNVWNKWWWCVHCTVQAKDHAIRYWTQLCNVFHLFFGCVVIGPTIPIKTQKLSDKFSHFSLESPPTSGGKCAGCSVIIRKVVGGDHLRVYMYNFFSKSRASPSNYMELLYFTD